MMIKYMLLKKIVFHISYKNCLLAYNLKLKDFVLLKALHKVFNGKQDKDMNNKMFKNSFKHFMMLYHNPLKKVLKKK